MGNIGFYHFIMDYQMWLLIIKTLASLVFIILPCLILYRDWKYSDRRKKEYHKFTRSIIWGWIITAFISTAYIWIDPIFIKRAEQSNMIKTEPKVSIEIEERDGLIILMLETPKSNSVPIEDLFFSFDIPGKIINNEINYTNNNGHSEISSTRLAQHGDVIIAETLHLKSRTILPEGYIEARISYIPTDSMVVPGSEEYLKEKRYYIPLMDLRDISRCIYTWLYNGQTQTTIKYIDLTYLEFIQKDNAQLLKNMRQEEFYNNNDINIPNRQQKIDSLKSVYSDEWLKEYEFRRRNW